MFEKLMNWIKGTDDKIKSLELRVRALEEKEVFKMTSEEFDAMFKKLKVGK
jgi:hypothetical protein